MLHLRRSILPVYPNTSGTICINWMPFLKGPEWYKQKETRCTEFSDVSSVLSLPVPTALGKMGNEAERLPNLQDVKHILALYSRRPLTYGSDALNAILGARIPPLGVPIGMRRKTAHRPETYDCELTIRVAFNWAAHNVLTRRTEFPSWFPHSATSPRCLYAHMISTCRCTQSMAKSGSKNKQTNKR